jgi:hypothetical protein
MNEKINTVSNLISQRERKLNAAYDEQRARQEKLTADAAAEASLLQPEREAIATKRRELGSLVANRDNKLEMIRVCKAQLGQQQGFVTDLNALCSSIIGQTHEPSGTPSAYVFRNYLANHPHLLIASLLVEKMTAALVTFESELEVIEHEIRSLS